MEHKIIADLLRQGGFLMVNKAMLKMFGINNTLVLSILLDKGHGYNYEHFYCTREYIQAITGLDLRTITKTITFWRDMEVVSSVKEGVPATTYYTVNVDTLVKIITPAFEGQTSECKNPLTCSAPSEYKNDTYSEYKNELSRESKNVPTIYIDKDSSIKDSSNKTPDKKVFSNENTKKLRNFNWDEVMDRWNELATRYKIPTLRLWSDSRKKAFTARMKDLGTDDINVFFAELEKALHCSLFLQGRKYIDEGNGNYRFENLDRFPSSFDFFTSKQGFARTIEGNYADKDLVQVWERKHKKQTTTEKEGVKDAEKGGAL